MSPTTEWREEVKEVSTVLDLQELPAMSTQDEDCNCISLTSTYIRF